MEKMDLSKKVLASLLTMSCVYLGGTSVLPTAGAAENAADNNVGQLITNGGSLTGGDVLISRLRALQILQHCDFMERILIFL